MSDLEIYHEVMKSHPDYFERVPGKGLKRKKELALFLTKIAPDAHYPRLLASVVSLAIRAEKEVEKIEAAKKFLNFKQKV